MLDKLTSRRDFYAGLLLILIGLFAAVQGISYGVGTLLQMRPGFMPLTLGTLLVGLGIVIASGLTGAGDAQERAVLQQAPEWRGWLCIIAGPVLFILFGACCGLIPATFACVFISALGDRSTSWRGAAILASLATIFGAILFVYVLGVSFPLLRWGVS